MMSDVIPCSHSSDNSPRHVLLNSTHKLLYSQGAIPYTHCICTLSHNTPHIIYYLYVHMRALYSNNVLLNNKQYPLYEYSDLNEIERGVSIGMAVPCVHAAIWLHSMPAHSERVTLVLHRKIDFICIVTCGCMIRCLNFTSIIGM